MNRHFKTLLFAITFALTACLLPGAAGAQTWIELNPTGSPPLQTSQIVNYDAANNRLIAYFPGNPAINAAWSNQVWVLTNANGLGGTPAWIQLNPTGTPPGINIFPSAVYDSVTNRLIVY